MVFTPSDNTEPQGRDKWLKTSFNEPLDPSPNCYEPMQFNPNDAPTKFVQELKQSEFQKLIDCVLQGAIIIYPNEVNKIYYSLVKSVECPVSICDLIIECIDDPNSGVSQAITNVVSQSEYQTIRDNAQAQNLDNLAEGTNELCDEDILWSQCIEIVKYLDQINLDVLELIEVATNPIEGVANVIGDVTFLDEASVDALISWVDFVIDNIKDNYEAQITQSYLEDRACEIFCIAKDNNCVIDPTTMYEVWQTRLSAQVSIGSLIDESIDYLVSGIWTGTEIADFMFFAQLAIRSQLGKLIGTIAYSDVPFRLALYATTPNSGHTLLCTDCLPELPTLVLYSTPCFGGGGSPATLTEVSAGRWSVTTAQGSVDRRAIWRDSLDRTFTMSNFTVTGSVARTAGYRVDVPQCFISPSGQNVLAGLPLSQAGVTTGSSVTMEFDVILT